MTQATSFWARRKAAVAAEAAEEARTAELAQRTEEIEGKEDSEILAEMGLPDPASMEQGDDFSAFMSRDVPEHLRKRALRTLWRSNPVLANVDGLNEYDDDYRAAMLLQEPIKTAYQVGKGMKAHIDEMARQAREADEQPSEPEQIEEPEIIVAQTENEPSVDMDETTEAQSEPQAQSDTGELEEAPTPRRMRFRFEEATA